ncbi:hypothetical protein [Jannaschia sp. R86511]|uniref:hypothetical protein n=1 Tax=Jannaschia sp. R86511 TaxID=3093853 RepID=UPI0036D315B6
MPAQGSDGSTTHEDSDRRLLRDACAGDGAAVAALYDRHSGALYATACCVLGPGTPAEDAVVDALVDACRPHDAPSAGRRSVRHELARATYERCAAAQTLTPAERQRAVLALCLHGEHTYRDAVALTGARGASLPDLLRDAVGRRDLAVPA